MTPLKIISVTIHHALNNNALLTSHREKDIERKYRGTLNLIHAPGAKQTKHLNGEKDLIIHRIHSFIHHIMISLTDIQTLQCLRFAVQSEQ